MLYNIKYFIVVIIVFGGRVMKKYLAAVAAAGCMMLAGCGLNTCQDLYFLQDSAEKMVGVLDSQNPTVYSGLTGLFTPETAKKFTQDAYDQTRAICLERFGKMLENRFMVFQRNDDGDLIVYRGKFEKVKKVDLQFLFDKDGKIVNFKFQPAQLDPEEAEEERLEAEEKAKEEARQKALKEKADKKIAAEKAALELKNKAAAKKRELEQIAAERAKAAEAQKRAEQERLQAVQRQKAVDQMKVDAAKKSAELEKQAALKAAEAQKQATELQALENKIKSERDKADQERLARRAAKRAKNK